MEHASAPSAMYKYIVLGGGNAAGYCAREFVSNGLAAGELCIVGSESVVSYERPALSKAFLALQGGARLPGFHTCVGAGGERQLPEWYAEKGITFKTGATVTAANLAAKSLTLQDGSSLGYEHLIIATGSEVVRLGDFKTPGAELSGVMYLRNEADGQQLLSAMQGVKDKSGKVVIVGGGYIGMEVAAGVVSNGLDTTLVYPEPHLMARLFTPQLAAFYEGVYASKGVTMCRKGKVTALEGDAQGKVAAVVVAAEDGSVSKLPADLVVVGVGARPCVSLFKGQLDMGPPPMGGILVDGSLRTSKPGVWAVGDVAAYPTDSGQARQEHISHARLSAAHAVRSILGLASGPYTYLPYFYSREFNLSWQFWGSQGGGKAEVVHFGDFAAAKFGAYWVADGKVVGVFLEGATPEEAVAAKKLAQDAPPVPQAPAPGLAEQGISFAMSRM